MREDGFTVDKLLLTTDPNEVPSGLGPAESPRTGGGGANQAPVITSTAVTGATVDQAYSYDVEATDADGDTLSYSLTVNPSAMSIDAASGLISWTPTGAQIGNHSVTVQVSDGQGGSAAQSFTISVSDGSVDPSLIAYWRFDEGSGGVAANEVDANANGTIEGATWEVAGKLGAALRFDGVNDRVSLPGSFNITGNAFTIALWFNADDFDIIDGRLISKAQGTAEADHLWMLSTIQDGATFLRARLSTQGTTHTLFGDNGTLSTQQWVHAALVYDGSELRLYQNAVLVGSQAQSGALDTDSGLGVAIGNQPSGAGSKPFDGLIDEVRIYNRALSAAELAALAGQ
jgi:hypothetical protein